MKVHEYACYTVQSPPPKKREGGLAVRRPWFHLRTGSALYTQRERQRESEREREREGRMDKQTHIQIEILCPP